MESLPRSIAWEAPEHHHVEKGNDWFFALGIIVVALVIVAVFLEDVLFALFIGIAGGVLAVAASRRPRLIPYEVTLRGLRIGDTLYPYSTLESYWIEEEDPRGPQLLVKSSRRIMPLLVVPLPVEQMDVIGDILAGKLKEEHLSEPFLVKVLELFGF